MTAESLKTLDFENTSYTTDWMHELTETRVRKFELDGNDWKVMKFLMMDRMDNMWLSCDQRGVRYAMDDFFSVLEVPLAEDDEKFVAFIPRGNRNLSECMQKLDTTGFHKLLHKLSPEFIHFEIPAFNIQSTLYNHTFRFEIPDKPPQVVMRDPMVIVNKPCEWNPVPIPLNRPFLFAVLNRKEPRVMGVFNGIGSG